MENIPDELKYSKSHEWVRLDGNVATVGITFHAQDELGDIVYLGLPEVGRVLQYDEQFGEIESVKAVSELFSPVVGEVIETNTAIESASETVNSDPYGNGWLIKVRLTDPSSIDALLNAEQYLAFTAEGGH